MLMFRVIQNKWRQSRRGGIVLLVAVVSTMMVGMAAMTIDLGTMYIARAELQRSADAAALAGASALFSNASLAGSDSDLSTMAYQRSSMVALENHVQGRRQILVRSDVQLGRHDYDNPTAALLPDGKWNAVEVTARRVDGNPNGPVPLLFAGIWGKSTRNMMAVARAAADDRMAGYRLQGNTSGIGFMPFAIPVNAFYDMVTTSGSDEYYFSSNVKNGSDGVREVLMYPWKWKDANEYDDNGNGNGNSNDGSGNFGILDMNRSNNGASALSAQIRNGGASVADVQAQFNTSSLMFYDSTHTASSGPRTYSCSGTPGMKTSIEAALSDQVGKVFGFFLHNGVSGHGTNATYSICGIFFARIMAVELSGGKNACGLIVQPVAYTDPWVVVSTNAESSRGTVGRLTLVR